MYVLEYHLMTRVLLPVIIDNYSLLSLPIAKEYPLNQFNHDTPRTPIGQLTAAV